MRNLARLLLFLPLLATAGTVHVTWNFEDFVAAPIAVKRVKITPLAPYGTNGSGIITGDWLPKQTSGVGALTVSNMVNGYSYRVELTGSYTNTIFTNSFSGSVTGAVNGKDYISSSIIVSGNLVAYSQAAANAKFLTITNSAMTGTPTLNGTNLTTLFGSGSGTGTVFLYTNAGPSLQTNLSGTVTANTNNPASFTNSALAAALAGDAAALASSAASLTLVSNVVAATNGVIMGGKLYSTVDAALSNSYVGATLQIMGDVIATNHLVLSNQVRLDFKAGRVLNYYTNIDQTLGINLFGLGSGCSIVGNGTVAITNCLTNAYQSCIGIDWRQGDTGATNWLLKDLQLEGWTDVMFFWHSNATFGEIQNVKAISRFDVMVSAVPSSSLITVKRSKFYSDGTYYSSGQSRAVTINHGTYDWTGCEFQSDNFIGSAGTAGPVVFRNTFTSSLFATGEPPTNTFNNCTFIGNSTNTAFNNFILETAGNASRQSRNTLNSCTLSGTNCWGILHVRGTIDLNNTTVLPVGSGLQISNTVSTAIVNVAGGNLTQSRLGLLGLVNWQGDFGMSNKYAPNGYFTNITTTTLNVGTTDVVQFLAFVITNGFTGAVAGATGSSLSATTINSDSNNVTVLNAGSLANTPLNASQLTSGTVYFPRLGNTNNVAADTVHRAFVMVGTNTPFWTNTLSLAMLPSVVLTNNFSGTITATAFSGSGSGLTALNASELTSGTVANAVFTNLNRTNVTLVNPVVSGDLIFNGGSVGIANADGKMRLTNSLTLGGNTFGPAMRIIGRTNDDTRSFYVGINAINLGVVGIGTTAGALYIISGDGNVTLRSGTTTMADFSAATIDLKTNTLVRGTLTTPFSATATNGFIFPTNTISIIVSWTNGVAGTWNSNGSVFLVTSKRGATNQAFTLMGVEAP